MTKGTWTPPAPEAAKEPPPPIIGKIETARPDTPPVPVRNDGKWVVTAVSNYMDKETPRTVVMMRDPDTGELKSWDTKGTFTLEQLQGNP